MKENKQSISRKIKHGNLNINIRSSFITDNSRNKLSDILFSIAKMKLNEAAKMKLNEASVLKC